MKAKILGIIVLSCFLSGCLATVGAVFGGLNTAYSGVQEYREFKKNVKEIRQRRTALPLSPDPWEFLTHCTTDSGTYCLSDSDYIKIIGYNEALKNGGCDR